MRNVRVYASNPYLAENGGGVALAPARGAETDRDVCPRGGRRQGVGRSPTKKICVIWT